MSGRNTKPLFGAVLAMLFALAGAARAASPLGIRTIPQKLSTWAEIREFVLRGVPRDGSVKILEQGDSVVIQQGGEQYQLLFHQGDVIQFSSLAQKETGSLEPVQYGRSVSRRIGKYVKESGGLKWAYDFVTKNSGIKIREEEAVPLEGTRDFRSALVYPEDGGPPFIQLSNKYAKHPVFGVAHELQHFLNQPLLPQIVETHFAGEPAAIKPALKSYIDEYLAVSFEIKTYKELVRKFPHLANQELNELSSLPDVQIRQYVFQRWRNYYKWPDSLLEKMASKELHSADLLEEIRDFQKKFGTQSDLSAKERRQLYFDQKKNPKIVDETVIASPKNTHLPWVYRPEAGASFPVRTLWIPEEELNIAKLESQIPAGLKKLLIKEKNGRSFYAFFIHPLSEDRFRPLIERFESSWDFVATPSSSNRTLEVRSMAGPEKFYVKTSLAAEIAGIERTVPAKEVSRSVGHSLILQEVAKQEKNLLYLPEPLAVIPKGMERGGQVVRLLEPQKPAKNLVPLFSFYDTTDGNDLTGRLAKKLGISRYEFLKERIAKPLLAELENLRDRHHLVHEAHAQNILVEVDGAGKPTGRFVFKDLAGLSVDLSQYPKTKDRLPHFGELAPEYYQENLKQSFKQSFDSYFKSGFLYGADQYLAKVEPESAGRPPLSTLVREEQGALPSCEKFYQMLGSAASLQ